MPFEPVTTAELMAALPHVLAAPKDGAVVTGLCLRPSYGQRSFPDRLEMTVAAGVIGDGRRWLDAPWLKRADGSPDPSIQVSILPLRVMNLVWRNRDSSPHPGDTIVADLDTSEANLPVGSLLRVGSAVVRVSGVFNDACVKWKVRYGADAKDWVTAPGHPALRLRGILCSIEKDGAAVVGDVIEKLPG